MTMVRSCAVAPDQFRFRPGGTHVGGLEDPTAILAALEDWQTIKADVEVTAGRAIERQR